MKTKLAAAALLFTAAVSLEAHAADLEVRISGLRSDAGGVRLALFDGAGNYLKQGRGLVVEAGRGSVGGLFTDLPSGTYALAIHHDENGNGKMETNLFGFPKEGHGFSNNAKAVFGPPSFSEAAFFVGQETTTVKVNLNY